jgi:hypothetical protein
MSSLAAFFFAAVLNTLGPESTPRFRNYPAAAPYTGRNHPLVLDSEFSRSYRTRLRRAIASGMPAFAGRYIVARWGCGSDGCSIGAVIDASTGRAIPLPGPVASVHPLKPEFQEEEGQMIAYELSSRLMIRAGDMDREGGKDVMEFHELRGGRFRLIMTAPYGRRLH